MTAALAMACQGRDQPKDAPALPVDAQVSFELTEVGPDPASTQTFAQGLADRPDVRGHAQGQRIRLMRF